MAVSKEISRAQNVPAGQDAWLWHRALATMLVAGLSAGATYISTGPTLAFYLLGPFLIALMLPPLVSMESKFLQRMLIAGAVIDGTALAWLITALGSTITISQWLAGYLVLIAWGFALGGLTAVLRRLRLPSIPAGAIAVAIGLAWLTWPVWLSAALRSHQSLAAALICRAGPRW